MSDNVIQGNKREKGVGLIVVILLLAFLLTIGLALVSVTRTGPDVSGNVRLQSQAFNAAEAGFDSAWVTIEDFFAIGAWTSFDNHYLTEPTGIDNPLDVNYFRRYTDEDLLQLLDQNNDGASDYANVIFYQQPFVPDGSGGLDLRYTYTAFLIDDEGFGGTPDPGDCLLVCIGVIKHGSDIITARLEIGLAIEIGP